MNASLMSEVKIESSTKKPFTSLSLKAQEVGKILIEQLNIAQEDILASTANRIIILSASPRPQIFNTLSKLGYIRDASIRGSGQGGFRTQEGIQIIIKPKNGQGPQSSGKQNETSFYDLINSKVKEANGPIVVVFKNGLHDIVNQDIVECRDSSVDGSTNFSKADAQLLNSSNEVVSNISLKKRNAVRWESSKTRLIDGINIFKSFIEKTDQKVLKDVGLNPIEGSNKKFKLFNPTTQKVLSKVVIKGTPHHVIQDVIFGNDFPSTLVIKEDFEVFTNYTFKDKVLTIMCHKIYTKVEDVMGTDDEPVYAFSNHIGQTYGIEFRSFSKGLLYKDNELKGSSKEIDFKDLK